MDYSAEGLLWRSCGKGALAVGSGGKDWNDMAQSEGKQRMNPLEPQGRANAGFGDQSVYDKQGISKTN
jgi:hypothetical protein